MNPARKPFPLRYLRFACQCHRQSAERQNDGWQAQDDRLLNGDIAKCGCDRDCQDGGDACPCTPQRSPGWPPVAALPAGRLRGSASIATSPKRTETPN